MHENREISCASWSNDQDRSIKAINHNADVNVQEKSDCAVVAEPAEQRGATFRGGRGGKGADRGEHGSITHASDTERNTYVPGVGRCATSSIGKEAGTVHRPAPSRDMEVAAGQLLRVKAASSLRTDSERLQAALPVRVSAGFVN